jgi:uncharacterized protein (UPF0276 family)
MRVQVEPLSIARIAQEIREVQSLIEVPLLVLVRSALVETRVY